MRQLSTQDSQAVNLGSFLLQASKMLERQCDGFARILTKPLAGPRKDLRKSDLTFTRDKSPDSCESILT